VAKNQKEKQAAADERDQTRKIIARLRKLEGQVRGLERMIENKADCEAVLIQFSAVKAAFEKVGVIVIRNAIRECIREEVSQKPELDKAIMVLEKYLVYLK
jgi:DNA-binding FrmR family transcriptional regulator